MKKKRLAFGTGLAVLILLVMLYVYAMGARSQSLTTANRTETSSMAGRIFSMTSLRDPTEATVIYPSPFLSRTPDEALDAVARTYPRVDGSTSTYPLQVLIACHVIDVPCEIKLDWFAPTPTVMAMSDDKPLVNIQHTGTHGAYMNLIENGTDLILVARAPSDDEQLAAQQAGVVLDVRPVARDAFVFLANSANPIDSLTLEQIRGIYTGEITDWVDLGWPDTKDHTSIIAFRRNPNSGSQELMETLVMQGEPMIEGPELMMLDTMSGVIKSVIWVDTGIGYSVYYYVTYMVPHHTWEANRLKTLAIEGVLPTRDTIRDQSYPLTADVYLVARQRMPVDSMAILLRDWLLSPGGQAVVEESGYVALTAP